MDTIFYDRKNNREVKSSELMQINLVETRLVIDSEEYTRGEWLGQVKHPAYLKEKQIGSIGYKSEKCPKYSNWDLTLHTSDLVFLRLVEEEEIFRTDGVRIDTTR